MIPRIININTMLHLLVQEQSFNIQSAAESWYQLRTVCIHIFIFAVTVNHVTIMFVLILSHVILYPIMHFSVFSSTNNLSIFFLRDFPVVRISPDGLQAHSRVNPVVGLLPVISGRACFRMTFPSIANAAVTLQ